MTYFIFNVSNENENDKLLVTLTSLDKGNSCLFLNKGSKLPTKKEYDISSNNSREGFI